MAIHDLQNVHMSYRRIIVGVVYIYFQFDLKKIRTNPTKVMMSRIDEFNGNHLVRKLETEVQSHLIEQLRQFVSEKYHDRCICIFHTSFGCIVGIP